VLLARHYGLAVDDVRVAEASSVPLAIGAHSFDGKHIRILATHIELEQLDLALAAAAREAAQVAADLDVYLDVYVWQPEPPAAADACACRLAEQLDRAAFPGRIRGVVVAIAAPEKLLYFTFRPEERGFVEQKHLRGLHPMVARRLHLWRLARFDLERLPSPDEVFLFRAVAHDNRDDERLIALAEVRDLTPLFDRTGRVVGLPHLERAFGEALAAMRSELTRRPAREHLCWNRVQLLLRPPVLLKPDELVDIVRRLAPATEGLGLERVLVGGRLPDENGVLREHVLEVFNAAGAGVAMVLTDPPTEPMAPLSRYDQKVVRLRQQGLSYPYDTIAMLTPRRGEGAGFPPGEFVEHDLAGDELVPVDRPPGENRANVVVGVVRSFTAKHPEGMARVILLGDPSKEMGSLAEPECRRIIAALALAQRMKVPLEWFAVSAGAKISMESGTENMDWISRVLRRIVEFTQGGGEINVVVTGINVGAQPYWNAEATMLMHTRGILVMCPGSAMVLTGKEALEFSGSVSAEDNQGIGGFDRIMGPNGQAQYRAASLSEGLEILFRHYDHTYLAPGEQFPRKAASSDPVDRDVRLSPHGPEGGAGFETVGDIFSQEKNPDRKKPFDIRRVMAAVGDQDHPPMERWRDHRGGDTAVIWDAHLGGRPVCLIGIEARPLPRLEFVPADGPELWSAGTLFPQSSKKIARAINGASGIRPVVVLASLSGFDGSPESMRRLQLEYGAEIGRAVVNFRGPFVFCVVSRYHGGAFVVFSKALREEIEVVAVEGARASVIGGAPAAAVVFAREVETRARKDPRVVAAEEAARASGSRLRLAEVLSAVRSEKVGEVAEEFDSVHTVERALKVGSLDRIISARDLRPYLVDAVERGIAKQQG
jgi:acetyl-CoA carboxylase carboxyltransferase component